MLTGVPQQAAPPRNDIAFQRHVPNNPKAVLLHEGGTLIDFIWPALNHRGPD
ncbi:MAG TPA: hypothetical protein PK306_03845 [Aquabacterium sp.]|uniref:hypothetical protein n=1 Tax=Piscinibacter sp. TaxID=1903157 RepID=UPI002C231176|nr:hypothetical protein [Aquabacterium sp.]